MTKYQDWKFYVTNPPPEVIANIEVRGHFLNIFGIIIASIVLMIKGYWYVTLAFIFSILVSYSQGMSAYARYKVFKSFLPDETYPLILTDKSFSRRRQRLLKLRYNKFTRFLVLLSCFTIAVYLLGIENKVTYLFTIKTAIVTLLYYLVFQYVLIAGILEYVKKREFKDEVEKQNSTSIDS